MRDAGQLASITGMALSDSAYASPRETRSGRRTVARRRPRGRDRPLEGGRDGRFPSNVDTRGGLRRADAMATFVDLSVIVCAFDLGNDRKREVALEVLGDSSFHVVVSAQVLNEFSSIRHAQARTAARSGGGARRRPTPHRRVTSYRSTPASSTRRARSHVDTGSSSGTPPSSLPLRVAARRRRRQHGWERASSPRRGDRAQAEGDRLQVDCRLGRRPWSWKAR